MSDLDSRVIEFIERYSAELLVELRHYVKANEIRHEASTLITTITEIWVSVRRNKGTTPETEAERLFWFAFYALKHGVGVSNMKMVDGSPAAESQQFIEDIAKGVEVAINCLQSGRPLPPDYDALRPPNL